MVSVTGPDQDPPSDGPFRPGNQAPVRRRCRARIRQRQLVQGHRPPLFALHGGRRGCLSAQPRDPHEQSSDARGRSAAAVASNGDQARSAGNPASARAPHGRNGRRARERFGRTRVEPRGGGQCAAARPSHGRGARPAQVERAALPAPEGARLFLRRDLGPDRLQLDEGQSFTDRGPQAFLRRLRQDRVRRAL
jgi:hypothetical protein